MLRLLGGFVRWLARHFVSFLVIVAILLLASLVQKEVQAFLTLVDTRSRFKAASEQVGGTLEAQKRALIERVAGLEKAGDEALKARLAALDGEIKQKESVQRTPLVRRLALVTGDGLLDDLKLELSIAALHQEREYLATLHSASLARTGLIACREELEQRRQKHAAAYREVGANDAAQAKLIRENPVRSQINPLSVEFQSLRNLEGIRRTLYASNQAAHESYEQQRKVCDGLQKIDELRQLQFPQARVDAALTDVLAPFKVRVAELDASYSAHWLAKFSEPVIVVLPAALGILLALILLPIAIKLVFYFVLAPLASRRPAICLLPDVSGAIAIGEGTERRKISQVSVEIVIDESEELLVHPEYLQSTSLQGEKDTRLFLDWAYPLTSLAAGLVALTRIRASAAESWVISAAQNDPFGEIAALSVPAGAAVVFQPHGLVGVVQRRDSPLCITSHWRLGSLNAWLTLQFRYLVFHGPARLIVKGGRGVVLESTQNGGRSIDQAATLGFSANLNYATTRCETLGAYLMSKQSLFNDHFSGGPGFYLYEEMPRAGKKGGIAGRGLEGLSDAVLKAFGI